MAGHICSRGKNTWLVRVYMGTDAEGKRKNHNKTIHGTKKEAQAYLNKVLREKDTGSFVDPSKEFIKDFMDNWLENVAKPRIRAKTYRSYEQLVRLYIKPSLGDIKLSQLTPAQIHSMYSKMTEEELSSRTVRYTHTVLRNALDQAVKFGELYRNPADIVDLPRHEKKEMKALTPEEAARFLSATTCSTLKPLFSLMVTTGMRPSEALGLKWPDVDLNNGRITVNRILSRTGKHWKLEEPKTTRSRRTIPLSVTVIKDLREHKKKQSVIILAAEEGKYNEQDFVFADDTGEPLSDRNIIARHFKPLLKDAKLPDIRLYDLRHTCATLLLSAGENPKVVSERLGHANITLTLDTYSHVLPDMQQGAADKLEELLFNV
ncbi:MAG: tyrosine-type recombinase/integrase [Bacillota bacterium]|nr:tyrosine-type recombinase/integrase [Bacillota bacterium]